MFSLFSVIYLTYLFFHFVPTRPRQNLEMLEALLLEVNSIQAYLPNCLQLQDSVIRAREWIQEAEALQVNCISTDTAMKCHEARNILIISI